MLSVDSLVMKSEAAEVRLKGDVHIGKSFNLSLDGASSLDCSDRHLETSMC